jgi:hypothetical protein
MDSATSTTTHHSAVPDVLLGVSMIILSVAIYGVGLIAPLTPSQGVPSPADILVWFVIPLVLLFFGYRIVKSRPIRIAIAVGLIFVFCTGSVLLIFLYLKFF